MSDVVGFTMPEKLIKEVMTQQVEAAIIRAMGPEVYQSVIAHAVNRALTARVNSDDGKPDRYQSDRSPTWLTFQLTDAIRETARKAVMDWIQAHESSIRLQVEKSLEKNRDQIAQIVVASFVDAAKSRWAVNVDLTFDKAKQD